MTSATPVTMKAHLEIKKTESSTWAA